jgi:hypothetical protein
VGEDGTLLLQSGFYFYCRADYLHSSFFFLVDNIMLTGTEQEYRVAVGALMYLMIYTVHAPISRVVYALSSFKVLISA